MGTVLWTLRQRRYARLLAAMSVVALACIAMGSFEWHRYLEKRHDNAALRSAARAAPVTLTPSLLPLAGTTTLPDTSALRFRQVTAVGRYDVAGQLYVADQNQGGHQGFTVLTPFRTATGVLLVGRGFVAAGTDELRPADVAAPPSGTVRITARLQPAGTASDRLGVLGHGEITAVNPVQQSARLGAPVYAAWGALAAGAPGADGLDALPGPDLSNPSGGAAQWQLLSYVVQWYAFAVLALIAPFLFSRAELKDARRRFLDVDEDRVELDADDAAVAALPGAGRSGDGAGQLVRRGGGEVATVAGVDTTSERYRRAERLADRYGRSLGTHDRPRPADAAPTPRRRVVPDLAPGDPVSPQVSAESSRTPHRPVDDYHAAYNDHLWRLAMADGDLPVDAGPDAAAGREVAGERWQPERPRVVDVDPVEDDDGPAAGR